MYKKKTKWEQKFHQIRSRCQYPYDIGYKNYGAKGIKCLIMPMEIKRLWIRDNASKMERPTIDRIDNDGDYTYENCRFIENRENILRGNSPSALNHRKTVCKRGHKLEGKNLKIATDGSRKCRPCLKMLNDRINHARPRKTKRVYHYSRKTLEKWSKSHTLLDKNP